MHSLHRHHADPPSGHSNPKGPRTRKKSIRFWYHASVFASIYTWGRVEVDKVGLCIPPKLRYSDNSQLAQAPKDLHNNTRSTMPCLASVSISLIIRRLNCLWPGPTVCQRVTAPIVRQRVMYVSQDDVAQSAGNLCMHLCSSQQDRPHINADKPAYKEQVAPHMRRTLQENQFPRAPRA